MNDGGEETPRDDADALGVEYGDVLVFTLSGIVDAAAIPGISTELRTQMEPARSALVINMAAVTFLDSSGIGMLFDLATRLGRRRQRYAIVAPSDQPIRSVLGLAGLDQAVPIVESVDVALIEVGREDE
jgi:anti-sigma B factor antagonist